MKLTPAAIRSLKAEGFLHNREGESFSARIIPVGGSISAEQIIAIGEAARLFGGSQVCFTSRMTVELPHIPYEQIQPFKHYISEAGLATGGTGAKVRPVTSCKGSTCVFGLYDTNALNLAIHNRFYEGYRSVPLPHKFKIGVGGCPNNCIKADLNDFGIVGQRVPLLDRALCKECTLCNAQKSCPIKAINRMESELPCIDKSICNNCGRCIKGCPFGAIIGEEIRFKVFLGGRWGKQIRIGTPISRLFNEEEVLSLIEKSLLLFIEEGSQGERFASVIERLGMEEVELRLLSDDLLLRKKSILTHVS
ncbi:MAG TPA: (4Fe-4S)-binding protein [Sphaerochaeta sp.]|nr:(4Fe-4S)-binding protein [Sphaerochaeta sp.]